MGRYFKDLNHEVELILKLYYMDAELRKFIDPLYIGDFAKYNGKLHIAIRHNIDAILDFIERRDNVCD